MAVILLGLVLALVSGCVTVTKEPGGQIVVTPKSPELPEIPTLDQIKADIKARRVALDEFTYADIVRAGEIAREAPVDQVGAVCYPALAARLRARLDAPKGADVIGAVSLFERVNKIIFPFAGPDDTVSIACTALRDRTVKKLIEIDAKIAALVASSGITGVGDLPGMLNAAKKVLALLQELGVHIF